MAKQQKALARMCARPPPQDFTWDELVSVMARFGYDLSMPGGSHGTFVNESTKDIIKVPRPHPGNCVRRCYLREICEKFRDMGVV